MLIENVAGEDSIHIADVFKHSTEGHWIQKKCDQIKSNIGIRLPASIYPPDGKGTILSMIQSENTSRVPSSRLRTDVHPKE